MGALLGYNRAFPWSTSLMESERLNLLANTLGDLDRRSAELRRYL
jgi:hypothetical protein